MIIFSIQARGPPLQIVFCSHQKNDLEEYLMKTIKIKDYYGKYVEVPVSDELANEWRLLENETQRVNKRELYHRSAVPFDEVTLSASDMDDPESQLLRSEQMGQVYAALDQLSPVMKLRLLKYAEVRSFEELSKGENCSSTAIKKSVYRAIRNIRAILEA